MPRMKWTGSWTEPMTQLVLSMQQEGKDPISIHTALRAEFGRAAPADWEIVERKMQNLYFANKQGLSVEEVERLDAMPNEQKRQNRETSNSDHRRDKSSSGSACTYPRSLYCWNILI